MLVGITVYVLRRDTLPESAGAAGTSRGEASRKGAPLTREELKRIGAILILFAFTIMFWAAYEQKGASLNLFAKRLVSTAVFGWTSPPVGCNR